MQHLPHVELAFRGEVCFLVNRLTREEIRVGGVGTQLGFDEDGAGFVSTGPGEDTAWLDELLTIEAVTVAGQVRFKHDGQDAFAAPPRDVFSAPARYVPLRMDLGSRCVLKVFEARWFVEAAQLWWQVRDLPGLWGILTWGQDAACQGCQMDLGQLAILGGHLQELISWPTFVAEGVGGRRLRLAASTRQP